MKKKARERQVMNHLGQGPTRLDFKALPLMEAVVRLTLRDPLPITYNLVNGLWHRLSDDFPQLTEPTETQSAPGLTEQSFRLGLLPGALYLGHRAGLSIGLQPQL